MIFLISLMLVSVAVVAVLVTNLQPEPIAIPVRVDEDIVYIRPKLRR